MASRFKTLRDQSYVNGMNTLDDAKTLPDTQCCELVNAFPDYPVKLRRGCDISGLFVDKENRHPRVASHPFRFAASNGREYVLFWELTEYWGWIPHYKLLICEIGRETICKTVTWLTGGDVEFIVTIEPCSFFTVGDMVHAVVTSGFNSQSSIIVVEQPNSVGDSTARLIPNAEAGMPLGSGDIPQGFVTINPAHTSANPFRVTFFNDPNAGTFKESVAFGYAVTLVRRTELLEDLTVYHPGMVEFPEHPVFRGSTVAELAPNQSVDIEFSPSRIASRHIDDRYGFTHLRVYRTGNIYGVPSAEAVGATLKFLRDIPIELIQWSDDTPRIYIKDNCTVGELEGETNLLSVSEYTMPPSIPARALYFKDRLWLLGTDGRLFYSEVPGGDGGTDLGWVALERAKYALMFAPLEYRVDLDLEDRTAAVALESFGDDLYIFKKNKVFSIINGAVKSRVSEHAISPYRTISDRFGCTFPDSICRAIISDRNVLFFQSAIGPVAIEEGGATRALSEFKIKELWPDTGAGLYKQHQSVTPYCGAAWWDNTLYVFATFGVDGGTESSKMYGYHSSPENSGAFEVKFADLKRKPRINNIFVTNDGTAWAIGTYVEYDEDGAPVIWGTVKVHFMSLEGSYDKFSDIDSFREEKRPHFELLSRKLMPGQSIRDIAELYTLTINCDFTEDQWDDKPFRLDVRSNRHHQHKDYYSEGTVFQSNHFGAAIPGTIPMKNFLRSDGKNWKVNELVGYSAYVFDPADPHNGDTSNVQSNTEKKVIFTSGVKLREHAVIRFIPKASSRVNIQFTPSAGFIGEYFQYKVTKVMPSNRHFNWYSAELDVIPRQHLGVENMVGGMDTDSISPWNIPVVEED